MGSRKGVQCHVTFLKYRCHMLNLKDIWGISQYQISRESVEDLTVHSSLNVSLESVINHG